MGGSVVRESRSRRIVARVARLLRKHGRLSVFGLLLLTPGPSLDARSDSPEPGAVPTTLAELGEFIFFDPRLSTSGTVSCATCHDPELSFTDGRSESVGELGILTGRNSPTLWHVGSVEWFLDPKAPAAIRSRFAFISEIEKQ
jgi:cytochrome c peroxidase